MVICQAEKSHRQKKPPGHARTWGLGLVLNSLHGCGQGGLPWSTIGG